MLEPYTINTAASWITVDVARMAIARTMRDGVFETIKDWRVSPEQEAMVANLAISIATTYTKPLTEEEAKKAVDHVKSLLSKYPLSTFCGYPMVVDPKMDRDKIELRDQDGKVLVRIVNLAIPYYAEMS